LWVSYSLLVLVAAFLTAVGEFVSSIRTDWQPPIPLLATGTFILLVKATFDSAAEVFDNGYLTEVWTFLWFVWARLANRISRLFPR
jgi:uncharacterized membrane protein YvlD (DUF360 family)